MDKRVFMVSHTHWDREWYFTRSEFQMMNADMMEHLLGILDSDPDFTSFMLDGQLLALEDYLEVFPERMERIREYVERGRLVIGPWYVLPDEYLASGEAHIRNFLEGMRIAESFGGGMRLGYLPDSFGHPSQMPQIIKGLGMRELIFWRGTGPEVKHAEFIWEGKDGSSILALNMLYGYSNAANLKEEKSIRFRRLDHEIKKLMDISCMNLALLMNGSDHIAPDSRIPAWLQDYQTQRPELTITHGTLREYTQAAHERSMKVSMQIVRGELRSGYRAYLLGDTLSTRMPLKQFQRKIETMVENNLEPLYSLMSLHGYIPYPVEKFRHLWKLVLQNLPHDSICGCGTDPIHREMGMRYAQMEEIGKHLFRNACLCIPTAVQDADADGELAVFSFSLVQEKQMVNISLQKVLHPLRYVDYEQDQKLLEFDGEQTFKQPTGILLTDAEGKTLHGVVRDTCVSDTVESNLMTQPNMNRVAVFDCAFTDELPPMAIKRYKYHYIYEQYKDSSSMLENAHYILTAQKDGTLSVFHKPAGRWYHGLAKLIDVADVGDEYTFDGLPGDQGHSLKPKSVSIRCATGIVTINGVLELPKQCADDRQHRSDDTVSCAVTIMASLAMDLPRIDVKITVDNQACDHRLIAQFPFDCSVEEFFSDSAFAVDNHVNVRDVDDQAYQGWMEKPNNSCFLKNFAALRGKDNGLAIFVKGLPHCELIKSSGTNRLHLTLLRCVGWLSRNDLRSRDGNGGWSIPTPDAQLIGGHEFEFAIYPYQDELSSLLFRKAQAYAAGSTAMQVSRQGAGSLAAPPSLIWLDNRDLSLSAFKMSHNGQGYILRLINMSPETVRSVLSLNKPASFWLTNLAEENQAFLGESLSEVLLEALPWQILTCRIVFNHTDPEN